MSDDNKKPEADESNKTFSTRPQTDDLTKTEYGKTWAVSEDASISQALSEILRAAMEDNTAADSGGRSLLYCESI